MSAAASGALNEAQNKVNNNNQTSIVQPQPKKPLNNNLMDNKPGSGQGYSNNKPHTSKVLHCIMTLDLD